MERTRALPRRVSRPAALLSAVPVHPWGDHGGITALAIDPGRRPRSMRARPNGVSSEHGRRRERNATSLTNPVHGIVIDPLVPDTATRALLIGVLKSMDRGATWSATGLASGSVRDLVIDPMTPTTLYALILTPRLQDHGWRRDMERILEPHRS